MGSLKGATEKSGKVTWRAKAQAFGETHVMLNAIDNALMFPGQYFDQETGLYQNYFRDYDPGLGRYVQSDPIGLDGGLNRYGYVGARPLFYIDPSGLIARYPGNDYRQWPNGGEGCEKPIWLGEYIVGWEPCEKGPTPHPDCKDDGYDPNRPPYYFPPLPKVPHVPYVPPPYERPDTPLTKFGGFGKCVVVGTVMGWGRSVPFPNMVVIS